MKSVHLLRQPTSVLMLTLSLAGLCWAQAAAVARHRSLADLTDEAGIIVHARVASVRVEPHPQFPNLETVVVGLQVEESLKGDAPRNFTFRQFVWDVRGERSRAGYHRRQELLLFLMPPSRYGLTSPVGLQQGRFTITRQPDGSVTASNGENNDRLFDNLAKSAQQRGAVLPAAVAKLGGQTRGPVALDTVEGLVRSLVARSR